MLALIMTYFPQSPGPLRQATRQDETCSKDETSLKTNIPPLGGRLKQDVHHDLALPVHPSNKTTLPSLHNYLMEHCGNANLRPRAHES